MKIVFVIALLLIVNCGIAQGYTLSKKSKIEKSFQKYLNDNKRAYKKIDTLNMLIYIINDTVKLPYGFLFYLGNNGTCYVQEDLFSCDSCRNVAFQQQLNAKHPKFHKLSGDGYKTKFPYSCLITTFEKQNEVSAIRYAYQGWNDFYIDFFKKFQKDKYQSIINIYLKELLADSYN
jgi:hypothetical protein